MNDRKVLIGLHLSGRDIDIVILVNNWQVVLVLNTASCLYMYVAYKTLWYGVFDW